ncbi:MAG: transporter permease [Frankiales bacterium]|nr:transporter permease [Frankiales bacterium]
MTEVVDTNRDLEAGLDALELGPQEARTPWWQRALSSGLPPVVALLVLYAIWQLVVSTQHPNNLPSPAAVGNELQDQWNKGRIQEAVRNSLVHGVFGFLISAAVGTPLGVLLARVLILRRALRPLITGLQSLPSVVWVPASILWFGLSAKTLFFVVLMGAIPSIVNGTISGIDQVPPLYLRVGHVLGARGLTLARHVLLPAALPGYLSGLKQGWAFSWRSLMAAELIASSGSLGLGQLIEDARNLSSFEGVIVGIFAILVVGIAVDLLFFAPLERTVLRRRGLLTH